MGARSRDPLARNDDSCKRVSHPIPPVL